MDHNLYIVILSLFVCFLFALVSIDWALSHIEKQKSQLYFLLVGSVTMGIAVWATHYMGMLSIQSPVPFVYKLPTMAAAFATGIVFSYLAFFLFTSPKAQNKRLAPALIFASGLISVHSIGMFSMHIPMTIQPNTFYIVLSVGSAIVFSALGFSILSAPHLPFKKVLTSLSFTTGVSLMHYIGEMALITVSPTFNWHNDFPLNNINMVATLLVFGATIVVLILYILEQHNQKKLVQQQIELLESEHRYNSLFELNPEGVYVIGPDRYFIKANSSFLSMTGYTLQELQNMPYTDLIKEEEIETSLGFLKQVLQGGTAKRALTIFNKCGQEIELEVTSIPYSTRNDITAVIGIAKDMTAINEAQNFKQRANTLAYVGELAAGLAHEIRNPLTSIKGFAQLFKSQNTTEETHHFLGIMLRETERINFIISQLMILARPHMILKNDHDLNAVIKRSLKFIEDETDFHTTSLELNLPDQPVIFKCEENLMTQLFLNILKNAIEATPSWGNISVQLEQDEESIHISIQDDGPGIPDHLLSKLGQPFYTTKEGNPGLGLLICYQIVENHGGKMQIESKEGSGTRVSLEFPLNVPAEDRILEMSMS
ncbi:ATP-binding protein [Fictibacillus sp. UD]|uniref:ATP-binding protein n=1 Tax=Fictibacillus sp. UD TaxID=3038777 RepID=UPI003746B08D